MKEITISNRDGILTVSSLQVAADFEKRHDKLVPEIERMYGELMGSPQNGGHPLFIEGAYQNPQNKQWYKYYELTRDGFSLLVMGFTGKKALEWKLKYIEAFNKMEQQLRSNALNLEEIISRTVTAAVRETVKETVKALLPLMQQSQSAPTCDPNALDTQLRRSRSIISQLEPALRIEVDDMLIARRCYADVQAFLAEHGVSISLASIGNYKQKLFRK